MTDALAVSVDDRRALWALTERHRRSETFAAVLLVRDALRRGATTIAVRTRGDRLVVEDDGAAIDDALAEIGAVLASPAVPLLHRLETQRGTDLLVALATAATAEARGHRTVVVVEQGVLRRRDAAADGAARNRVVLARPARLRRAEGDELRAWLPAPRGLVRIDGARLGGAVQLPAGVGFARQVRTGSGHGQIGVVLDDSVSRFTVLARGVWVTREQRRPAHLPLAGVWDSDVVPTTMGPLLGAARSLFDRAGEELMAQLAAELPGLAPRWRRRLRAALLRGATLPPAFEEVPLFDSAHGPLSVSLAALRRRRRVVVGEASGDVFADDDGRAFLRRQLGDIVVEALPPPRRRLRALLGMVGPP